MTALWTRMLMIVGVVATLLTLGTAAWAHPHKIVTPDHEQYIGGGGNHPKFENGVSCATNPPAVPDGSPIAPSWYGLETAHHGPDGGTAGFGDGCYATTGFVAPGADVENPVIR